MRKPKVLGGWGILLFCLPLVAFGHHARFEFDESELVEVRGTVTSVFWRNPHIRFSISNAENDAQGEEWLVEGSSINRLERLGVTEDMLNVDGWVQPEDRAWRCDPPGMLENMSSPYPMELVDGGDEITLRLEQWDGVRTIHMDRSIDSADPPPTRMGYSVGRWEGRTLIVESKKFESGAYDDRGTPQSAAMRVVERFTLSEDETRLDWSASVIDPETFTEPVARQNLHFSWVPGEEVKPFDCSVPGR